MEIFEYELKIHLIILKGRTIKYNVSRFELKIMDQTLIKQHNRNKRGQISEEYLSQFSKLPLEDIIQMLKDENPQNRTAAAKILCKTKNYEAVNNLCNAMKIEKALYSRIAMSEALGEIGEIAVHNLIHLIGCIGNNQEKELPKHYFKKKSFPLPRDLAARTLVKIGIPALPELINTISNSQNSYIKEQALDAIGGITYKTNNQTAVDVIIQTTLENTNKILLWKSIRALSAFKENRKAYNTLIKILKDEPVPPILWETLRSLGKIGICNNELKIILENFEELKNPEIIKAYNCIITDLNLQI